MGRPFCRIVFPAPRLRTSESRASGLPPAPPKGATRPLLRAALATAALSRPPLIRMRAQSAYPALTAFLEHSTEDYHLELPNEEIRSALLEWYEQNRRRLPWRGDPPPYNGSTAGINSATITTANGGFSTIGIIIAPYAAPCIIQYIAAYRQRLLHARRVRAGARARAKTRLRITS